jgi:hypothetical protein
MILDRAVKHYTRVATKDSRGMTVNTYTLVKVMIVNWQPVALSKTVIEQWGGATIEANSKIMDFYPDSSIKLLDRILDGSTWYEIRAINEWPIHTTSLLCPVQGV